MKAIFSVLFLMIGLCFSSKAQTSLPKSDTISIKTKINCDHCLECGGCSGKINMSLRSHAGIQKVTIMPEENRIFIKYNPRKITAEKLRQIIVETGFEADGQMPTAEAVSKLDDCCQPK